MKLNEPKLKPKPVKSLVYIGLALLLPGLFLLISGPPTTSELHTITLAEYRIYIQDDKKSPTLYIESKGERFSLQCLLPNVCEKILGETDSDLPVTITASSNMVIYQIVNSGKTVKIYSESEGDFRRTSTIVLLANSLISLLLFVIAYKNNNSNSKE